MPADFSADHFIKQFIAAGYKLTTEELSTGFTEAARIFFLSGPIQYENFIKIIHFIANTKPEELALKVRSFKATLQTLKNKQRFFTEEESIIRGVLGLFYVVSAFSQPRVHQEQLGVLLSQTNVMEITQFIESTLFKKYKNQTGGTVKIGSFPVIFNGKDDVSMHYLELIKAIAKCAETKPFSRVSFCLEKMGRRIHLGYDGEQKKWSVADQTQSAYFNDEELVHVIAITMGNITPDHSVAFDTSIYTSEKHKDKFKKGLKECIKPHKIIFNIQSAILGQSSEQKVSQKIKKAHDGVSYAHLAAKFGYDELIQQIRKYDKNALSEVAQNLTPLLIAVKSGQAKMVDILMEHHKQLDLLKIDNEQRNLERMTALKLAMTNDDVMMTKKVLSYFSNGTQEIMDEVIEIYKKNKKPPAILPEIIKVIPILQALKLINVTIVLGDFAGFKIILEQGRYGTDVLSSILKNILSGYNSDAEKFDEKLKMIRFLIELGVDVNQSYCYGTSMIKRATLLKQPDLVKLFIEHSKQSLVEGYGNMHMFAQPVVLPGQRIEIKERKILQK